MHRELLNEFVIILAVYHVMCFTPLVPDIDTRIYIGYSFIILIVTHTVISLGVLIYSVIKESHWQWKKRKIIKESLTKEARIKKVT